MVMSLKCDGNIIEGNENLLKHATDYYTGLFDLKWNIMCN
jgi:hypothetical protein